MSMKINLKRFILWLSLHLARLEQRAHPSKDRWYQLYGEPKASTSFLIRHYLFCVYMDI